VRILKFKKYNPEKIKGTEAYGGTVKIAVSKKAGSRLNSGIFILKPGEALIRDVHENDEVFYLIEGRLTVQAEDTDKMEISKGEILLIPAGEVHYSKNLGKEDVKVFWCNIEPK